MGTRALPEDEWLVYDHLAPDELLLRRRLLTEQREHVLACSPYAEKPAQEAGALVDRWLATYVPLSHWGPTPKKSIPWPERVRGSKKTSASWCTTTARGAWKEPCSASQSVAPGREARTPDRPGAPAGAPLRRGTQPQGRHVSSTACPPTGRSGAGTSPCGPPWCCGPPVTTSTPRCGPRSHRDPVHRHCGFAANARPCGASRNRAPSSSPFGSRRCRSPS